MLRRADSVVKSLKQMLLVVGRLSMDEMILDRITKSRSLLEHE